MHAISLLLLYAACLCSASWVATPVLLRSGADRNACFSAPVVLRAAVAPSPAVLMLAAKKAKKGKGGGGGGGGKAAGEEDAASGDSSDAEDLEEVVRDGEKKMKRSLANVQEQLSTLRVGRATPDMLDRVMIDYFGTPTPLQQLASISVPSASQLLVDVYDKSALGDVEKGLLLSDIGMTPSNDGSVIRLNVPLLTKERRVELAKTARGIGEEGKTALRNVRRAAIDKIKKAVKTAGVSEDESKEKEAAIDKKLKKYEAELDEAVATREKEITTM